MRILFITMGTERSSGGMQGYNADVIDGLRSLGHEVDVLSRDDIPNKLLFSLKALFRLIKTKPDFIFYSHINFASLGLLVNCLCKTEYLVMTYGIDAWDVESRLKKLFFHKAKTILTISRYTKRRILEWFKDEKSKMFILPPTVDGKRFHIKDKSEEILERHNLEGRKVILTVARYDSGEQYKGYDQVIRALPDITESVPNIKYLLVGSGDDIPRIKELIEKLDLTKVVEVCGFIPNEELVDYYNIADLFIMPSKGEGFGIVFLEALACGTPVVAGNKDGSRDAVLDGELGLLIDPDDIREVTDIIVKFFQKETPLRFYDKKLLRRRVLNRLGKEKFVSRVGELIKNL